MEQVISTVGVSSPPDYRSWCSRKKAGQVSVGLGAIASPMAEVEIITLNFASAEVDGNHSSSLLSLLKFKDWAVLNSFCW